MCVTTLRLCAADTRHCLSQSIIEDPLIRHSAVLVFANKQDLVRTAVTAIRPSHSQALRSIAIYLARNRPERCMSTERAVCRPAR